MAKIEKQRVYEFLAAIPCGRVVTYGDIAEHLGDRKYARSIGNILHKNPDGDKYPCYKVVNARGELSENYAFGGIDMQRERLRCDGVVVEGDRVDLERYRWVMEKE